MFGSIRKHQQWIWLVVIALVIVSFVIFFSPDVDLSRARNAGQTGNYGSINGEAISRDEYYPAYQEARIGYFVRQGAQWPGSDDATQQRLQSDALSRLLLIRKLEEYNIEVSDMAVAQLAQRQLGTYPLERFVNENLRSQGLTELDYQNFLRHEAGIQQLIRVVSLGARMINPAEAKDLFAREYENYHLHAATFWVSNFLDRVPITPEKLSKIYTNRLGIYKKPDTIQVSYVRFAPSNYLAKADERMDSVTNFNENIDEFYRNRGADAFKDTNDVVMTEEAAKALIREEIRLTYALREAEVQANRFGSDLLRMAGGPDKKNKADDLDKLATSQGLEVLVTEPFSRNSGLEESAFPAGFRDEALILSTDNPVRVEPIVGTNGAYVIAFKNEIKGETPPLEEIKDRVTEDLKRQEGTLLASTAGRNFHSTLTNAMATNKNFFQICAQAEITVEKLPLIAPASRPPIEGLDSRFFLSQLQREAEQLEVGGISRYLGAGQNGGYILYLEKKSPVQPDKLQEELPEFEQNMRQIRISQAFDNWFRQQVENARLTPPAEEPQPAPTGAPTATPNPTPTPGAPGGNINVTPTPTPTPAPGS